MDGSKFCEQFLKRGHQRNIPVKLFQNLTSSFGGEDFLRNSSCPYSARSPHSPEPCFWADQNFANNFWKGSPKEHSCEIISKSDKRFQKTFLKNCLKNSISLPWQPEFLMESNSVNNFWRGPPKEHACQVWSKLAERFGRRRCLKKLLMKHDRHITTLKAPLEHVVLRWAKKEQEGHDGPGSLTWVIFPTIEFYIFVPLVSTCDPQGGPSFDSKGIIWIWLIKVHKKMLNTNIKSLIPSVSEKKIFEVGFPSSYDPTWNQLVTPGAGPVLTLRASYKQTWQRSTRRC